MQSVSRNKQALLTATTNELSTYINLIVQHLFSYQNVLRFNMIVIQGKGPDGKWTRKPLAYRVLRFLLRITRPPEICIDLVFKHIHAASNTACMWIICSIHLLSSVRTITS